MEMNVRMLGQPSIAFFVGAVIVQNHVQFFIRRRLGSNRAHKSKKVFTALSLGNLGGDVIGRDL